MNLKRLILLITLPALFLLASCSGNQENKIIGTWKVTRFDALPEEYPYEEWEFTADNDIIKRPVKETGYDDFYITTGRWGLTKRNTLNISKFDVGFNGDWEIVTRTDEVLRIVLKVFATDPETGKEAPSGQVLVEFTRSR